MDLCCNQQLTRNCAASERLTVMPARPLVGDLIHDSTDGELRVLQADEAETCSLRHKCGTSVSRFLRFVVKCFERRDIVLPLPRRREAIPECNMRMHLE
eukprot:1701321-Amphidinium_carterae.1